VFVDVMKDGNNDLSVHVESKKKDEDSNENEYQNDTFRNKAEFE
jgi:hypothetical protein